MFTRQLGSGIGHQCQHTTVNHLDAMIEGENEDDITYDDDLSDDGGNCANEDEDADSDGSDSDEPKEEDNTEQEIEFSDEDDTGYDDL